MSAPSDPRLAYRRRLQHRQVTVIGTLLAIMAVLTVLCLLIWSGIMPAPFDPGFSREEPKTTTYAQPCPAQDVTTVDVTSIPVNVYNGTDVAGLAGSVTAILSDAGMTVKATADWPRGSYDGNVLLTTSPAGVTNAYTLARAFSGTVTVTLDETQDASDASVSVVLGAKYASSALSAAEIAQLKTGEAITAPKACVAIKDATAKPADS